MIRSFLVIATLAFTFTTAVKAEVDPYRSYLKKIDKYNRLFRIGAYQLKDGKKLRDVDLFYYRSHKWPSGRQSNRFSYPLSFDLYCVWKNDAGKWTHKEVADLTIVDFDAYDFKQVVSADQDEIVIELTKTDNLRRVGARKSNPTKLFKLTLMFVDGDPITTRNSNKEETRRGATNP